ncbi:hypothetical protein [Spirosoma utsteinense]|uniref:Uncharacterized protein n=1 Tax=Spirosoma utsteinense TaxID=2585773 RepID=A0ABR6WBE4_9BACT|nr:hypothetical protein [Spirosoma utsteinense]MBC3787645.1 hypothetical protein [Spirosoma utsteinense]MBC3793241.1 hypothetical protein [Spirosoma utsteinense]
MQVQANSGVPDGGPELTTYRIADQNNGYPSAPGSPSTLQPTPAFISLINRPEYHSEQDRLTRSYSIDCQRPAAGGGRTNGGWNLRSKPIAGSTLSGRGGAVLGITDERKWLLPIPFADIAAHSDRTQNPDYWPVGRLPAGFMQPLLIVLFYAQHVTKTPID